MTPYLDLRNGNRARQLKDGRWEFERIALVTGVTGGVGELWNAVQLAGLPAVGSAHPTDIRAILEEIVPESVGTDTVRLTLLYRTPPFNYQRIEIGTTISEETVDTDINGQLMLVSYLTKTQAVTASVGRPRSTLVFRQRETTNPGVLSRAFVGKVNAAGWSKDPTAPARTWRCASITGSSDDGGAHYDNTYAFEYKAKTWDARGIYIDPATGRMPSDIVAETGTKTFVVCEEANFDALPI